ncbi:hypothetical protein AYO40_03580 [Planctomycetaceae bacterium SCGC AG-212-D15]|nr:hypothetical protein AYO40_03580 [Planctomycetaceae bacterium SCGC AG-212-D15]
MARYLMLAAVCLLMLGCSDRAGNALDVYEAVFRYSLQKHPADVKAYLVVDGKDPSSELLTRLRKDWPNLQPLSEDPKEQGLRLYAEGLKWGAGTAELKAGSWFPSKFGGEGHFADYHVVREKGQWVVKKLTNETMS